MAEPVLTEPVLEVDNLIVRYGGRRGTGATVIDDVSFDLSPGETLSLVVLPETSRSSSRTRTPR